MTVAQKIKEKAKANKKRIVLAEGNDERIVQAAVRCVKEGIAEIILLGSAETIGAFGLDMSDVTCVDIEKSDKINSYVEKLVELRGAKGVTEEKARGRLKNPLYFGVMMVKMGDADGMVAGAINATGDVLRPALQIIKTAPGITTVSSSFIMETPAKDFGKDGVLVFADCAVVIQPTAAEMAAIALASADTARSLCDMEPKVAMLSFSTKGSAKHELVDKVVEATRIAKESAPQLMIDGELQADAALVESVGKLKCPDSTVAGSANVLVFPDLQAGNIGYKLVQRFSGADAIGPICQGFNQPVNDLSRGCNVEDVIGVVAITAVQAQG